MNANDKFENTNPVGHKYLKRLWGYGDWVMRELVKRAGQRAARCRTRRSPSARSSWAECSCDARVEQWLLTMQRSGDEAEPVSRDLCIYVCTYLYVFIYVYTHTHIVWNRTLP